MSLFSSAACCLGIDIGTSSIKIVELAKEGGKVKLASYGFTESQNGQLSGNWQTSTKKTALAINKILNDAGMGGRAAVSALPTFSVFSSILNLNNVDKKDLPSAVHWEAKKVIPIPLEEMILDWKKIDDDTLSKGNMKILLTGAPRSLVKRYIEIFKLAQINLISLETETFSLVRSLIGHDQATIMLVELGTNTTDISVVEKGIPLVNRSIDIGGLTITKAIGSNLNIGLERAEQFKYDLGMNALDSSEEVVPKIINEILAPIINEVKYVINLYQTKNNKKVDKIVLSGGAALLPSLSGYLAKLTDLNVIIGSPWSRVSYPLELKPVLDEIGPRLAVAVGLALRQME